MDGVLIMRSKILANSVGVLKNPVEQQRQGTNAQNIQQSVIHTLILPIGLSIASPSMGAYYFIFAMLAYFTIFSDKNYYVKAILKTVIAFSVVGVAWFGLIGFVGKVASLLGVGA